MENKQLPDGLKDKMPIMQAGVQQWSQFVAWSWSEYLAYENDPNSKNKQDEEKLKKFFIKIVQEQARYQYAVSGYGDETKKDPAYAASLKIKKLVMGETSKEIDDDLKDVNLTLPQVYEKLNGTGKFPESLSYQPFMKKFHIQIVTDKFFGYVRDASEEEKAEILQSTGDEDVQYIIYLAYPPCPAFGKATVTEEQLINWMQGKNEYGQEVTDYLPPSAYIPVSMT